MLARLQRRGQCFRRNGEVHARWPTAPLIAKRAADHRHPPRTVGPAVLSASRFGTLDSERRPRRCDPERHDRDLEQDQHHDENGRSRCAARTAASARRSGGRRTRATRSPRPACCFALRAGGPGVRARFVAGAPPDSSGVSKVQRRNQSRALIAGDARTHRRATAGGQHAVDWQAVIVEERQLRRSIQRDVVTAGPIFVASSSVGPRVEKWDAHERPDAMNARARAYAPTPAPCHSSSSPRCTSELRAFPRARAACSSAASSSSTDAETPAACTFSMRRGPE